MHTSSSCCVKRAAGLAHPSTPNPVEATSASLEEQQRLAARCTLRRPRAQHELALPERRELVASLAGLRKYFPRKEFSSEKDFSRKRFFGKDFSTNPSPFKKTI